MSIEDSSSRQAQLDKEEREHLEDVVTDLRELVEDEIEYELEHQYDLTDRDGGDDLSDEEQATRERLVEAIDHENPGDKSWEWCYNEYINGVGYTFINRIAALRCMEVRDFIDQPVTQIGDSGLTPAAEQVLGERFDVGRDEALIIAFEEACERLDEEIELLFDTNSPYTVLDLDPDTFRRSIEELDRVSDEVWRADDVLGWVYEYYNVELLDDLRRKGDREGFEPEDVPPANQFYTPHWVVRMLTDNSLGKLYLEDQGDLDAAVEAQDSLTPDERKNRPLSPDDSPDIEDFCTYLVPSEEEGEPPDFDGPEDIRVMDPACGSGHFLLYAFDVLERIYRAETDLDHAEIPREILRNNLYGVDLDMRACQLAAFNLYLKGRMRAEAEGANGFDMPGIGIVCSDAKVADVEGVEEVFEEVAGDRPDVKNALQQILDAFEEVQGLGSLLDVRGTLGELFEDKIHQKSFQITLEEDPQKDRSLGQILNSLREIVEEHRNEDSFLAQDLRSFVRLLDVLAQDYDVALMNPPYGSRGRMPNNVKQYVEKRYDYASEYYINFFEVCERISKSRGRIGMLVPRSFMFRRSFRDFREEFVSGQGAFDFLAEFGYGILDNATVGTAGTIVRADTSDKEQQIGSFIRLHDKDKDKMQKTFLKEISKNKKTNDVRRRYEIPLSEFSFVPWAPLTYSVPSEIRNLHETSTRLDPSAANLSSDIEGVANVKTGVQTGNNPRFIQTHWESPNNSSFKHFTKGGTESWVLPQIKLSLFWGEDGAEIKRLSSSRPQNTGYYFKEGLTWTYIKRTGRRFGVFPPGGIFDQKGPMIFPHETSIWALMAILNSDIYHALFLTLTPERGWNPSDVGRIPWQDFGEMSKELSELAKKQFRHFAKLRMNDMKSPFYVSPALLITSDPDFFYRSDIKKSYTVDVAPHNLGANKISTDFEQQHLKIEADRINIKNKIETISKNIDNLVASKLGINEETLTEARTEIFLRTVEDESDRELKETEQISVDNEKLERQVKDIIHHFALQAIQNENDGIIPLNTIDQEPDMLDNIVERFHNEYDEYAEDRLEEVENILGSESAADVAYPNIRKFIEDDLFEYHVNTMENTPVLWKISSERLLTDPKDIGFSCFVDYHQVDTSLFDRVSAEYLEPIKAEYRERQSAADRRRNNESLTNTERSKATETYEECTSSLQQIAELENAMRELGSTNERDFDETDRELVQELAPKVAEFREETARRIETLSELRERNDEEWFKDTFSNNFWDTIDERRDEWLDALVELENACKGYAKPNNEPVEAHLADLFDYFDWRLKGSDHYSSSGILFMTYYFEREGADLLDEDGEPFEKLSPDERRLASLAMGLNDPSVLDHEYLEEMTNEDQDVESLPKLAEYKALAEEIKDRCQIINNRIPSQWKDRALSEITTEGYQPNHKYGVAINIKPLAEENVVPEIVESEVL